MCELFQMNFVYYIQEIIQHKHIHENKKLYLFCMQTLINYYQQHMDLHLYFNPAAALQH